MENYISSIAPYGVTFDKLRSDKLYVKSYSLKDYVTKITIDHINQCIKNNIESVDVSLGNYHQYIGGRV